MKIHCRVGCALKRKHHPAGKVTHVDAIPVSLLSLFDALKSRRLGTVKCSQSALQGLINYGLSSSRPVNFYSRNFGMLGQWITPPTNLRATINMQDIIRKTS